MFTQGFGSRCIVLIALLTGMGLMGVARPAQAQCQPQELTKLLAPDAAAADFFGFSLSVSGDTAVIGAAGDTHAGGRAAGSAYVFVRSGEAWTQQAKLTASDAAAKDWFGVSVSVSGDTAVIGAYHDDHAGKTDAGSAYVFVRSGEVWTQEAKLTAPDAAAPDLFGASVSVSGDTAVIGAYQDSHTDGTAVGSAYVFVRSGGVWTQQAKLTASDAVAADYFGGSVSISGDTAVIGASGYDHADGTDAGSAYVFVRSGGVWTEQAKLTASDAAGSNWLGQSVSVSGDTATIGAPADDHVVGANAGSVYVFVRSGGVWTQQAKLTASDAAAYDWFGHSVSVSGDTATIGAWWDNHAGGTGAGSAYMFVRSGGVWTQQAKLTASDAAAHDYFGYSVSVSGDTAVIGAYGDDHAGGTNAGSAYVFDLGCDHDDDGVPDAADNCPNMPNSDQADTDGDGAGDACDACPGFDDRIDCNSNGVPDGCDIRDGTSRDCNTNGIPDECDLAAGTSPDCNADRVPDECQLEGNDCNTNGVPDVCDIADGTSADCNRNGIPDECETDCNGNGVPDDCDIAGGTSKDCNANGIPDECEPDADGDGLIDDCDSCPDSDRAATIVIDDCDTRVPNRMLGDEGCTMADRVAECAEGARNHGAFVSRVAHLVNAWRHSGLINVRQAAAIQRCAARADIPRPHQHGGTHRRGGHGERD